MAEALKVLIVDDEPLARERLRALLGDLLGQLPVCVAGEAGNGLEALQWLASDVADVVLCDIRMPGMDGIELASHLRRLPQPPALIFTTAYDNYAVQAFELNAIDYLLKPVRAQRLLAALQKVRAAPLLVARADVPIAELGQALRGRGRSHLSCHERGRLLLVPVVEILYLRAELKYVSARTVDRDYLLDESLAHLESEFGDTFLRLHRSVLIARNALAGLEKASDEAADAYGWALVRGVTEKLPVSRRQWAAVRGMLNV